jgi:hypothetical protein
MLVETSTDNTLDMPMASTLDLSVARQILRDHDSSAIACLVAAGALVGDDLFDEEDGQPYSEGELSWLFEHTGFKPLPSALAKITGLLFARSGDEFTDSPEHFERLTSAIVEGDMFAYQDDKEDPTVPDLYWALYQVGLTIEEDDMLDEIGPRVEKYIRKLIEEEVEDVEGLAAEVAEEGSDPSALDPYITRVLVFRRAMMAADLRRLGCKAEWLADLDPELAHDLELYDD